MNDLFPNDIFSWIKMYVSPIYTTVVGDNINTMKTTFDLNFDLFQAV